MENGVSIYARDPEAELQLYRVIEEFSDIFEDNRATVDIPEDEQMPIHLRPDVEIKLGRVYNLGKKDREVLDKAFDKMHLEGKLS